MKQEDPFFGLNTPLKSMQVDPSYQNYVNRQTVNSPSPGFVPSQYGTGYFRESVYPTASPGLPESLEIKEAFPGEVLH